MPTQPRCALQSLHEDAHARLEDASEYLRRPAAILVGLACEHAIAEA